MRRKRGWTPGAADLEKLTEHLFYEVQMTFKRCGEMFVGGHRVSDSDLAA